MPINKSTEYGNISISLDAISSLAGGTITECYEWHHRKQFVMVGPNY